jgi:predicted HAD superfamily Cof-like phosphohydrolase
MTNEQQMVAEFHRTFDILTEESPTVPDAATRMLRVRLISEESDELRRALEQQDLVGIAKELADLLYVVYGTGVSCGIDLEPVFREVHRSNMSKVNGHKRADGKWVKPPDYSPARLQPILAEQGAALKRTVDHDAQVDTDGNRRVLAPGENT